MPVVRRLLVPAIVCLATVGPLAGQGVHRGLDPENLDTSCAPCQDFYRYANGGWLARTVLLPEYPSYGSFTELVERNNQTLRGFAGRPRPPRPGLLPALRLDRPRIARRVRGIRLTHARAPGRCARRSRLGSATHRGARDGARPRVAHPRGAARPERQLP